MSRTLAISVENVMNRNTNDIYENVEDMIQELIDNGYEFVVYSHDNIKLNLVKCRLSKYNGIYYKTRDEFKNILKNNKDKYHFPSSLIIISCIKEDMHYAATYNLILINPLWVINPDKEALKYGIPMRTPKDIIKLLNIIVNQKTWFYKLKLDEKTTVLSLTSANTFGYSHSDEEKEIINGFYRVLKENDKKYFNVLLYHFLAGMANNIEFKGIQDWAIFPSSGTDLNEDMWEFKERARWLKNGRKKEPIFIRHTKTYKSRKNPSTRLPCDRHFDTIKLNDKYKGKLKGRVVCVLDDYLTNGTSFETARNLLLKEGVAKIFFVSLGRYYKTRECDHYFRQDYDIKGDVYSPKGYIYQKTNGEWLEGSFDYGAIKEIESLYEIIYG